MIDFHSHLDLYPNPLEIAEEVEKRGIFLLSVTTTPSAWIGSKALERKNAKIRTALGLHPQLAHQRFSELPLFDKYLSQTRYVGEVGLDGGKEHKNSWELQSQIFEHILMSCEAHNGKIISIHSRLATTPVLDMLEKHPNAGTFILHWFTGTKSELRRAIEIGCWFSVNPVMMATKKSITLISEIPKEKILTETDGPFTNNGQRALMPWDVSSATEQLSRIWGLSKESTQKLLLCNLKHLITE